MTVVLNALESQGNANILSTPSLLTLDNEEAYITVGEEVPFVTGSYTNTGVGNGAQNPFQTIERQSVGVTLKVTPQINEGNAVVMDIVQEVSSRAPASVPLISSPMSARLKRWCLPTTATSWCSVVWSQTKLGR